MIKPAAILHFAGYYARVTKPDRTVKYSVAYASTGSGLVPRPNASQLRMNYITAARAVMHWVWARDYTGSSTHQINNLCGDMY